MAGKQDDARGRRAIPAGTRKHRRPTSDRRAGRWRGKIRAEARGRGGVTAKRQNGAEGHIPSYAMAAKKNSVDFGKGRGDEGTVFQLSENGVQKGNEGGHHKKEEASQGNS